VVARDGRDATVMSGGGAVLRLEFTVYQGTTFSGLEGGTPLNNGRGQQGDVVDVEAERRMRKRGD
jgi:hypothetical protein